MNLEISKIYNYFKGEIFNLETNEITYSEVKKSKALEFCLKNKSKIIIRPSGTEPKVKFYLLSRGRSMNESLVEIDNLVKFISKTVVKIL